MENKRPIPNQSKIDTRKAFYCSLVDLQPTLPNRHSGTPKGLELGNKKTGLSGRYYERIFVWNLPIKVTCPGESDWCKKHCYNADYRLEVYPIDLWCENWWWASEKPNILKEKILSQLEVLNGERVAVRLHSSGDFYSPNYIAMWIDLCSKKNDIMFWGYTRSWVIPDLIEPLTELLSYRNVSLFASWDSSMPKPPPMWRKSVVFHSNADVIAYSKTHKSYICPEQYNLVRCCADCARCTDRSSESDVIFVLH